MVPRFFCAVLVLAVAACASTPQRAATTPNASASASRSVAPTRDPASALRYYNAPDAMTPAQASAVLGPPDLERRDGAGALLTWRLQSCALVLGFANDRLESATPGPRRSGEPTPTLETCLAEARARLPTS